MNEILTLEDDPRSAITKMCKGNPGALSVLVELCNKGHEIDPDAFAGGMTHLMSLDSLNIYGPDVWMLYKDVCGQRISHMVAVLRAVQLGITPSATVKDAIQNYGQGIDVDEIFSAVCERLPSFAKANVLESATVDV